MDDADRAKIIEQRDRQAALEAALNSDRTHEAPRFDSAGNRICIDCGDKIPPDRIAVRPHAVRCVNCKQSLEQRARSR